MADFDGALITIPAILAGVQEDNPGGLIPVPVPLGGTRGDYDGHFVIDFATGAAVGPIMNTATPQSSVQVRVTFDSVMTADAELTDIRNWGIFLGADQTHPINSIDIVSTTQVDVNVDEMLDGESYEMRVCNVKDTVNDFIQQGTALNQRAFTGVGLAPVTALVNPVNGSIDNDICSNVIVDITDTESGIDLDSYVITVDGVTAFQNGAFPDGWRRGGSNILVITNGYRITMDMDDDYDFADTIAVVVTGNDNAGNAA